MEAASERRRTVRLDGTSCSAARRRLGLSREALENRSGLSVATVKRAENGAPLYVQTAMILARSLEVPLKMLLHAEEQSAAEHLPAYQGSPASVAVVPFQVIGDEARTVHVATGLVEDLICRLSRSLFPVIAASSAFGAGDGTGTAPSLGERLGADYLVTGSVQRDGSALRVNVRLVQSSSGRVLRADRYDRAFQDLFRSQDEVTARIVELVGATVLEAESAPLLRKDPADFDAWELAVRGSWHFHSRTREGNSQARLFLRKALALDSNLPLAWYSLAMSYQRDIVNQWTPDPEAALDEMRRACTEFGVRYPRDPLLHVATSYASVYAGDRSAALSRLSEAIHQDPNLAPAYSLYGQVLAMANDPDGALEQFETAMKLSPLDAELWSVYTATALAHFVAERYDDTVTWSRRATTLRPELPFPHGVLAAALGHLRRVDEARVELGEMLRLAPGTTLRGMSTLVASTNREIVVRYQAGLRLAGLPSA